MLRKWLHRKEDNISLIIKRLKKPYNENEKVTILQDFPFEDFQKASLQLMRQLQTHKNKKLIAIVERNLLLIQGSLPQPTLARNPLEELLGRIEVAFAPVKGLLKIIH